MSFAILGISYNVVTVVMVLYCRLFYLFKENVIYMSASFVCVCMKLIDSNLYCCAVHLHINIYVHQLMHLFISLRKH